jgi:ATP-dependent Clp protease ATP-binding subunit ClpB
VKDIVKILISHLQDRLADRQIELNFSDEALTFIAEAGYDAVYGARPLKRYITHNVETKLARAMIAGGIREKTRVDVNVKAGNLTFAFI